MQDDARREKTGQEKREDTLSLPHYPHQPPTTNQYASDAFRPLACRTNSLTCSLTHTHTRSLAVLRYRTDGSIIRSFWIRCARARASLRFAPRRIPRGRAQGPRRSKRALPSTASTTSQGGAWMPPDLPIPYAWAPRTHARREWWMKEPLARGHDVRGMCEINLCACATGAAKDEREKKAFRSHPASPSGLSHKQRPQA